jgi:hypothetical protein
MSSNYIPRSKYESVFERDTDHMRGMLDEDGEWITPDPVYVRCSACRGTGLTRYEEDECDECYGEGEVPG